MAKPPKNVNPAPHIVEASEHYSAPIPHPNIMKGYAEVDPSFPNRIFSEFEKNSEHFRNQEETGLNAKIDEVRRAQWMAFITAMVLLGIVVFSLYLGNEFFAKASGLTFFVFIVNSFLGYANLKKKMK